MAETQEGFAYIAARPIMLGITLLEAVASVFGLDHTMLTIFASDILRVGAHGFGLLQSARGLGAVIGSSLYLGRRPTAAPGTHLVRFGDLLRHRLRAFRIIAIVPAFALADDLCRRERHDLGRVARHHHANDHAGNISRSGDGGFSVEQPRPASARPSRVWYGHSVDRGAGGNGLRRAVGNRGNFAHRLESPGDCRRFRWDHK